MKNESFWRDRLQEIFDNDPSLKMSAVSKQAGFSPSWVRDLLVRGHDPSLSKILKLCETMGINPSLLFMDIDFANFPNCKTANETTITVQGVAVSSEEIIGFPAKMRPDTLGKIPINLNISKSYIILVNDSVYIPRLNPGDIAVFNTVEKKRHHELEGELCLIKTISGQEYLKVLRRTSKDGVYDLESLSRLGETIERVLVQTLSRLDMIIPNKA